MATLFAPGHCPGLYTSAWPILAVLIGDAGMLCSADSAGEDVVRATVRGSIGKDNLKGLQDLEVHQGVLINNLKS